MSEAPESAAAGPDPFALVLAPLPGDARAIPAILEEAGISSRICRGEADLRQALLPDSTEVLFVIVTHEAATPAVGRVLIEADEAQPEWSRLPMVFLVRSLRHPPPAYGRLLREVGQPPLVVLERPVKPATLKSVLDIQRRVRRRQFEIRNLQEGLREAEQYKDFLLAELRHRTRNSLSVLQALFRLTARRHSDIDTLVEDFGGRFNSLIDAYGRLASPGSGSGAQLRTIFREHVEPYTQFAEQLRLNGPDVAIDEKVCFDLALVVHELATNAAKYGALSTTDGHVDVGWELDGQSAALQIAWQECDGPPVDEPSQEGLGSSFIRNFGRGIGADTRLEFRAPGLQWKTSIPRGRFQLRTAKH